MSNMLNNTSIRVSLPLEEIIQIAYKKLASQEMVPYLNSNVPIDYECRFNVKNGEGKVVSNVSEVTVSFGLVAKGAELEKKYQAGDWIEPETDETTGDKND